MDINPKCARKPVKMVYRYALPACLDVSNRRPRQSDGRANLSLVQAKSLSMLPHELPEAPIKS